MSREKPAPHNERSHMLQLRPTTVKNNQLKITKKKKSAESKGKIKKEKVGASSWPTPRQQLSSISASVLS